MASPIQEPNEPSQSFGSSPKLSLSGPPKSTEKVSQLVTTNKEIIDSSLKSQSLPQLSGEQTKSAEKPTDNKSKQVRKDRTQNQSDNPSLTSIAKHRFLPESLTHLSTSLGSEETEEQDLSPGRTATTTCDTSPRSHSDSDTANSSSSEPEVKTNMTQTEHRKVTRSFSKRAISGRLKKSFNLPATITHRAKKQPESTLPSVQRFANNSTDNLEVCTNEISRSMVIINSLSNSNFSSQSISESFAKRLKKINHEVLLELEKELFLHEKYKTNSESILDNYKDLLNKALKFYDSMKLLINIFQDKDTIIVTKDYLKIVSKNPAILSKETKILNNEMILEDQKQKLHQAIKIYLANDEEIIVNLQKLLKPLKTFVKQKTPLFFDDEHLVQIKTILFTHFINQSVLFSAYVANIGSFSIEIRGENSFVSVKDKKIPSIDLCTLIPRQLTQYHQCFSEIEKKLVFQIKWKDNDTLIHPFEDQFSDIIHYLKEFIAKRQEEANKSLNLIMNHLEDKTDQTDDK